MLVVMPAVDAQHMLKMSATEDEAPIETVGADAPHRAFCVGVRIRAWGAETRSSRGDDIVLVDEATEQVAAAHMKIVRRRLCSDG